MLGANEDKRILDLTISPAQTSDYVARRPQVDVPYDVDRGSMPYALDSFSITLDCCGALQHYDGFKTNREDKQLIPSN